MNALKCLLCNGTKFVSHFGVIEQQEPLAAGPQSYRITHSQRSRVGSIVRCVDCGLVLLPPPSASEVAYVDGEDPQYVEQADQRIANAHALLELVPAGGRLLDIGCACGFLLVAARDRGFDVEGVELSQWAADYARTKYGLTVHRDFLQNLQLPAESFDIVTLSDVIEHLTDPRAVLREVRRLLRPGGRIVLLTPDIGSRTAKIAGAKWWGLLDDHYFYFSRRSLNTLLESEGFAVESMCALGRRFPLSHWAFKLSQYSEGLYQVVIRVLKVLRLDGLQIPLNLGDQMACTARKK